MEQVIKNERELNVIKESTLSQFRKFSSRRPQGPQQGQEHRPP
jgi:hypothetical protein